MLTHKKVNNKKRKKVNYNNGKKITNCRYPGVVLYILIQ